MKKKVIRIVLRHQAQASPQEIIENYVDYGHEVYLHGKYSKGHKKNISKITKVSYKILGQYQRQVTVPVRLLGGLIAYDSIQQVQLIPWTGIVSAGDLYGFPAGSTWQIEQDGDGLSTCTVTYEITVPWIIYPIKPLLAYMIRHLRERVWEEDRIMLERRDRLIKRGFGDGDIRPFAHKNNPP